MLGPLEMALTAEPAGMPTASCQVQQDRVQVQAMYRLLSMPQSYQKSQDTPQSHVSQILTVTKSVKAQYSERDESNAM